MAATTKLLQLRPKLKPFPEPNPIFPHFFSSNSNSDHPQIPNNTLPPTSEPPTPKPFSFSSIPNNPRNQNPSSKTPSLEEIRKNLAEFRRRTDSIPPPPSFQEIYKRNVNNAPRPGPTGKFDLSAIRTNLRNFNNNNNYNQNNENRGKLFDSLSLSRYKDSFKLRPNMDKVIGGSENLPVSIFGKEMMRDKEGGHKEGTRAEFVRMYSHGELGEKLKMLRPAKKKEGEKGWFSLKELNDRLAKLRETEEKESESRMAGVGFRELKESLVTLRTHNEEKANRTMIQRLDVLGQLGGTPSFMLHPPKEELVEKYFHPDNMSSEEKMKLELQKVRDEFKMSESDCGSSRVQVPWNNLYPVESSINLLGICFSSDCLQCGDQEG
ncbi:PREDICTED: uncharacterized protein LOC109217550 [Nicotiana attenuata]|uniref:Uncharacterized protein n=1 Tax=Nicotiana attenuata TaxID=49451 RepID=A0A1J6JNB5_NICAT|nr:PREDICTED: uncharacterized protein LOC109217550 [Nicotiana attenuata]OIT19282.1 hypothetical protein A4A49_30190 [Nicotiana attenuata]OIT22473.1 hypothetical protein A4A49_61983 [Nicotiana attenuata]OIT24284.1 hypothetical protein A4A49_58238 [Nicotiana attenuata]